VCYITYMATQSGGQDSFNINGLYLKHYLEIVEKCSETFKDKDAETFLLYTEFIKSQITDDDRLAIIEREANEKKKTDYYKQQDDSTKTFLEGFCTIRGCMKFLNHTLHLVKKDVEVNADQNDDEMPQPADTP
jgi:hypothetical protein